MKEEKVVTAETQGPRSLRQRGSPLFNTWRGKRKWGIGNGGWNRTLRRAQTAGHPLLQ